VFSRMASGLSPPCRRDGAASELSWAGIRGVGSFIGGRRMANASHPRNGSAHGITRRTSRGSGIISPDSGTSPQVNFGTRPASGRCSGRGRLVMWVGM
jgi:hypothetical protein